MCKWGTRVLVKLTEPDHKGHPTADIDKCIAPIVQALNDAGIGTVASCCGHNKGFGNIALKDGRELIICPDFETSRKTEKIINENLS